MAILGVKVQLHMIVTGPQGTLGSSTSPWSTYTYAAPALAGTGARTDVDADNTYTFSVDGINFGAEDSTLGSPGEYFKRRERLQSRIWKSNCRLTFLFILPSFKPVSLSFSRISSIF